MELFVFIVASYRWLMNINEKPFLNIPNRSGVK